MSVQARDRLLALAVWGIPVVTLAWIVRVSVAVNYDQALIYPVAFAAAATCMAALWRSRRPWLKLLLLTAGLGLTLAVGLASIIQGGHTRRIAIVSTELMLERTAAQYAELLAQSPDPPACDNFPCLADTLYGSERWPGLVVFMERERSLTFYPRIPYRDPWGCRILFEPHPGLVVLRSSGPDRRLRTADDIVASVAIATGPAETGRLQSPEKPD